MSLLRLHWIVYAILAPILITLGIWGFISGRDDEAAKARARQHAAPAAIALENFNPTKDKSDFDEVVLRAQVDVNSMVEVVKKKRGVERGRTTIARLYPVSAKDTSAPAPAVLVAPRSIPEAYLQKAMVSQGAVGPVLEFDGRITTGHSSDIREALRENTPITPDAIHIEPFIDGRDAALRKGDPTLMLWLGGIGGLVSGLYAWFRRRRTLAAATPATAQDTTGPATPQGPVA